MLSLYIRSFVAEACVKGTIFSAPGVVKCACVWLGGVIILFYSCRCWCELTLAGFVDLFSPV